MVRFKALLGVHLMAKNFDSQGTVAFIKCNIMNKMTSLGMPDNYAVVEHENILKGQAMLKNI